MARAAAAAGTVMCLSTLATPPRLRSPRRRRGGRRWFQLYPFSDAAVTRALMDEAVAAGFEAVVLTVDAPPGGNRERDIRTGFTIPAEVEIPSVAAALGGSRSRHVEETFDADDPGADLGGPRRDRRRGRVPLLVKGLLTAEDAVLAVEHGAAGIVVSNHGGRQLDRAVASAEALPEMVEAVAGRATVLVDGGIRRGTDVAIALALGADAVLVGRPTAWGLAAGGAAGAERVLAMLAAELELTLALLRRRHARRPRPRAPAEPASDARIFGRRSVRPIQLLDGPANPQRRIAEPRPWRRGAVLRRLRQRRLVDLLRPRRHRRVRARADAGRLRHLRADLRRHRRHLRRGDRDVPRGRRLLELRPPRLQRVRQLRRGLGADAQLHDHGRDLGLLRAPLPGRLLALARRTARAT